ncbi:hypothetical protein Pedsa_2779 [Pseudopedobacter saltans DSM 12145]|uniref:Phage holin family protein n=1 Tax=Pseudopedobacter saltans (strain ATCC 51119 / DSM 12145 / JCM 21818 / CCUG 39354 / LMG 10337 / NBRC 100064 / NCIMB 13643) TaxID=762903 RepID=F0S7R5_PSESL|nr:phage holin family protein [Pseudopedobacter saltans]ADY53320.1 hypothetical protein Pedsa_2779 [Pseudopedobacter saltans DSM 12145]
MEELLEKIKEYIETRFKLAKLVLIEKGTSIFADIITTLIVVFFLIVAFLFISIGLGFYISELIGNTYGGFLIVGLFYFLIALIVFLTKDKYIEKSIVNGIIKKIFKREDVE